MLNYYKFHFEIPRILMMPLSKLANRIYLIQIIMISKEKSTTSKLWFY